MARDRTIQACAAGVIALCLCVSTWLSVMMTATAGQAEMTYTDRAEDNDRWEVSAGIAMGAFRGVFVNLLWIRANDMKEAGKFYEAVELAKGITRLQPRFPRVWVFHAWNLAYNISVMTKSREERWNWVNQGIQLLRDQAIPANPNDLLLHKELAWIYLHKIQGVTDDANPYYKRMVAAEWSFNMGMPPPRGPEDRDRAKVIAKYAAWVRRFADAPTNLDAVRAADPAAGRLIDAVEAMGFSFTTGVERRRFLQRYEVTRVNTTSLRRDMFLKALAVGLLETEGTQANNLRQMQVLSALIEDGGNAKAWEALLTHVRRRVLVEDYRMEPDRMVRYTEKYGPIDWRNAAGHALYWSARGVEESLDRVQKAVVTTDANENIIVLDEGNRKDYDFLNTDRVVAQSVQELFRSGDVYFDFTSFVNGQFNLWQGTPNGAFAESYGEILNEMRERAGVIDAQSKVRYVSPLSAGYENFMIDVCLYFYRRGERGTAGVWLERIRTFEDMNTYDTTRNERFRDLDEFAINEMKTRATSTYVAVAQVTGSIIGAYSTGLLGRDPELFQTQFKYAKDFHAYYMEQQLRMTAVNLEQGRTEQMDREFEWVAGPMFEQFVTQLGIDEATYVFGSAPRDLQFWAYDGLQERFGGLLEVDAKAGGKPFSILFPKPDGIEAFRVERARKMQERLERSPALERQ